MADVRNLKWDGAGLVTVVVQDAETGEVRMVAHANAEAVEATLRTREAHFYSRSRAGLWKKGETSGNTLAVHEVWSDCDGDSLLYLVHPAGPSCHTGADACFFTRIDAASGESTTAAPTLLKLERTLKARAAATAEKSYTKSLLDQGAAKINAKLIEEADELAHAIASESEERVASEAADVTYHLLVGLVLRQVPVRTLLATLSNRFNKSGHEEKKHRGSDA